MNAHEERQARRRAAYERLARNANAESDAAVARARRMLDVIPFGQPVHGAADARYRARAGNVMQKALELDDKAEYYRQKAASVGTAGVSSDDEDAVAKLREQVAELEGEQEKMKAANKLVRRADRAGLAALGYAAEDIAGLLKPDFCGRLGFPAYRLSNNGANIRRIHERIQYLERQAARPEAAPVEGVCVGEAAETVLPVSTDISTSADVESAGLGAGASPTFLPVSSQSEVPNQLGNSYFSIRDDAGENRVMVEFAGKPATCVRLRLKAEGFRWSPSRGAWVRQRSAHALAAAKRAMGVT